LVNTFFHFRHMYLWFFWLAMSNCCINPILYYVLSKRYLFILHFIMFLFTICNVLCERCFIIITFKMFSVKGTLLFYPLQCSLWKVLSYFTLYNVLCDRWFIIKTFTMFSLKGTFLFYPLQCSLWKVLFILPFTMFSVKGTFLFYPL
jgi:hypothetical protein